MTETFLVKLRSFNFVKFFIFSTEHLQKPNPEYKTLNFFKKEVKQEGGQSAHSCGVH